MQPSINYKIPLNWNTKVLTLLLLLRCDDSCWHFAEIVICHVITAGIGLLKNSNKVRQSASHSVSQSQRSNLKRIESLCPFSFPSILYFQLEAARSFVCKLQSHRYFQTIHPACLPAQLPNIWLFKFFHLSWLKSCWIRPSHPIGTASKHDNQSNSTIMLLTETKYNLHTNTSISYVYLVHS